MASLSALEWFRSVAAVLGDDEPGRPFQRYPLKDLVAAYNRGMSIVYKYRLDLFTKIEKVELIAGAMQDVRGCFDNVLDVLAQVDEFGGVIKDFTGTKTRTATVKNRWNKPSCLNYKDTTNAPIDFVLDYVNIDPDLNGRFSVSPPVPCGAKVWVKIKAVSPPCEMFEQNMNDEQMPNSEFHNTSVWHYILASMLYGDRHAAGAISEANFHMQTFFNLLAIEYKQELTAERSEG